MQNIRFFKHSDSYSRKQILTIVESLENRVVHHNCVLDYLVVSDGAHDAVALLIIHEMNGLEIILETLN